jgi:hypothetical protein
MNNKLIANKVTYSAGAIKKVIKAGQERQNEHRAGDRKAAAAAV